MLAPGIGRRLDANEWDGVRATVLEVRPNLAKIRYYNGIVRETTSPVVAVPGQAVIFQGGKWIPFNHHASSTESKSSSVGSTLREFARRLLSFGR